MLAAPVAAAASRNAAAIGEVLGAEFRSARRVLEIGSGTGQHAVEFGAAFEWLSWQPSELPERLPGIRAWIDTAGLPNVLDPLTLDVLAPPAGLGSFDAVYSANTAHIMSLRAVEAMFDLAGSVLVASGRFCLYGPLRVGRRFSTASNADFDAALRSRNPDMGVRDLEQLDRFAAAAGLVRRRRYAMPANNELVTWHRQ